ncbi:hypothetical protein [Jiulongibacter sediminis]|nr:hypothetical protein [Jiulongibacter sediminis]
MKKTFYNLNSLQHMSNEETRTRIIANFNSKKLDDTNQSEALEDKKAEENESANTIVKDALKYPFQFLFKALETSSIRPEGYNHKRKSVFTAVTLSL